MPVYRKVFRIEQMLPAGSTADAVGGADATTTEQREILAELKALHELMERRVPGQSTGSPEARPSALASLKDETETIQLAIIRTKQEIATLHAAVSSTGQGQASRQLDAVAEAAERATRQVLDAAERIEEATNTLSAGLRHEQERALAQDIQDDVTRIFEACNFQDISGQRITKVLATLKFVEEHIARMMEIWGGIATLRDYAVPMPAGRNRDRRLVHGPALDSDEGHATQADVDALFGVS